MENEINLTIYGADQICASCVNAPSSKETYEWLQAAISRKYNQPAVRFEYIDIFNPPEIEEHQLFSARVRDDEYFYPVVLIDGQVIDEGNPSLKKVYKALEERGQK